MAVDHDTGAAPKDALDGWQREEILVDLDPNLDLEFLKKAEALSGKVPPTRTPRARLVKTHNSYVKKQGSLDGAPKLVKKLILALAYPPSSAAMSNLEPILLTDLHVESRHEGKLLFVRTITAPYRGSGLITVVEDTAGNADKVGIYNQGEASLLGTLPLGSILAIKEPYYRYSGENDYMISIDHPFDVLLLEPDDERVPEQFRGENPTSVWSSEEWRKAGDAAFIQKQMPLAVQCYSKALDLALPHDAPARAGLYAKRAGARIALKCFDEGRSDALASRQDTASDWKAYFMAGRASYELNQFDEARSHFESAIGLFPAGTSIPSLQRELGRSLARLEEASQGGYDFAALSPTVSSTNIHLDCASFLTNTEVRASPHHGRGLFATRDIAAGELLFCEKALCLPDQFNPSHNSAALFAVLLERCVNNPPLHAEVLDMYAGPQRRTGLEGTIVDGKPVVDVFLIESIRRKNCFSGPTVSVRAANASWQTTEGMSRGLWRHAALANHACLPNSMRSFVGDLMLSVASTNIRQGTEITHIYLPPKAVFTARVEQFRQWGFDCGCALCVGESASPAEKHEKRHKVLGEIQATIQKTNPSKHVPDSIIRVVERLTRQLEDLHEPSVYDFLPRMMLVWPTMWLFQAWRTRKHHDKVVKWATAALRNFGHLDPLGKEENGKLRLRMFEEERPAIVTYEVIKALKCLEGAWTALGEQELAQHAEETAKRGFKMIVGFESELDETIMDT